MYEKSNFELWHEDEVSVTSCNKKKKNNSFVNVKDVLLHLSLGSKNFQ